MYKRGDSIALTKGLLIAARRLSGDGLALSVTFGDSSPKGGATGVSVRPTRDEQSLILSETVVPCYRGQQLRNNILVKLLLISVAGHYILRHITPQASSRKLTGLPKAPPLGELASGARLRGLHCHSDAFSNASPAAFCRASMEMVQRAARSASEPSAGMSATSFSVLPLR